MLTRNPTIWISGKNILSLHCSGADLRQTQDCSGVFFVGQGHSAGVGEPSQAALGENYKALGKNYKADSFFYPPDSFSQAGLS